MTKISSVVNKKLKRIHGVTIFVQYFCSTSKTMACVNFNIALIIIFATTSFCVIFVKSDTSSLDYSYNPNSAVVFPRDTQDISSSSVVVPHSGSPVIWHQKIRRSDIGLHMNRNSRDQMSTKGGAGLLLMGYLAKACIQFYGYLKLISLCMSLSLLFLLLCPLLPFLIPALIIILLIGAALSIILPLVLTATGDGDLLVLN